MAIVFRTVSPSALKKSLDEKNQKQVKNQTGADIPPNKAVSWKPDGSVEMASSLVNTMADFAGITAEILPNNGFGRIIQDGSVPGILTGMGAVPGQSIYLGESPGTLAAIPPSSTNAIVLQVGYAEPSTTVEGAPVIDLLIRLREIAEL